jgi:hypothetical protein
MGGGSFFLTLVTVVSGSSRWSQARHGGLRLVTVVSGSSRWSQARHGGLRLEKSARKARAGLWADSKAPIAPWDFRSLQKQQRAVKKGDAVPLGYWLSRLAGDN